LKTVQTPGSEGGAFPSLAVTGDGSRLFLAWYDLGTQDLLIGILGQVTDVLVAQPSPTPQLASPSASGGPSCPKSGIKLEAPAGAGLDGFAQKSLTGTASKDLAICFDNQDPSVQHNVDVYDHQNGKSLAAADVITGPAQELLDVSALKPGSYFYQCDIHPTVMTGTLTVK